MIDRISIPSAPSVAYQQEWVNWDVFLGKEFVSFSEARQFAREKAFKTIAEWRKYCFSGDKPDNIPTTPNKVYKNDWNGYNDFLGLNYNYSREQLSFCEARKFTRKLGLKNAQEWREFCRSEQRPKNIHSAPYSKYKSEWKGWGDWLGTNTISNQSLHASFLRFEKAKKVVRSLRLSGKGDWEKYVKENELQGIPHNPSKVYKNEWKGWGDWLGTGNLSNRDKKYRSFRDARKFVHSLNLKNLEEWSAYCQSGRKPDDIPSSPHVVYKGEYKDSYDWLGNSWENFEIARKFARSLGLRTTREWKNYCSSGKKPKNIPSSPSTVYPQWVSWEDWLA